MSLLEWAFSNGCPMGLGTSMEAARRDDHQMMLLWALQHECPRNEATCEVLLPSARLLPS